MEMDYARLRPGWYRISMPFRRSLLRMMTRALSPFRGYFSHYNDPFRHAGYDSVYKIYKDGDMLLQINEAYQLYSALCAVRKVPGDVAEVGVYRGRSARVLCEAKGTKALYLFDTFEGLPDPSGYDCRVHRKGMFSCSEDDVRTYLSAYTDVHIVKGTFPGSAVLLPPHHRFSFVHLDLDLYEGTRDSLAYFYPKMNIGGILISHDYSSLRGVRKAFDDFFSDKDEPVIELSGYQCLVVKQSAGARKKRN